MNSPHNSQHVVVPPSQETPLSRVSRRQQNRQRLNQILAPQQQQIAAASELNDSFHYQVNGGAAA